VDLRHLRYFVAVAEERHFGRAARRLGIAQPPLSRQIQALESELDLVLLRRTPRGAELTAAGRALLEQSRHVFDTVDRAVHEARRAERGETGRIVVAYPASLAYSGIVETLRAFRAKAPGVEVVLRELAPQDQLNALRDRQVDIGFLRGPIADPEVTFEVLRREPLTIILPPDHVLAKRKRISLAALADEPFVLFPRARSPGYFDHLMGLFAEAGFVPRIVQEGALFDITSLVAAGFGVSVIPSSLRNVPRQRLAIRPIVGEPHVSLLVAWRTRAESPVLASFLDVVRRVRARG
jgi:DNA-binding transcriptional LysR family regulator